MALLTAFSLDNHGTLLVGLEIDIKSDLVMDIDRAVDRTWHYSQ